MSNARRRDESLHHRVAQPFRVMEDRRNGMRFVPVFSLLPLVLFSGLILDCVDHVQQVLSLSAFELSSSGQTQQLILGLAACADVLSCSVGVLECVQLSACGRRGYTHLISMHDGMFLRAHRPS